MPVLGNNTLSVVVNVVIAPTVMNGHVNRVSVAAGNWFNPIPTPFTVQTAYIFARAHPAQTVTWTMQIGLYYAGVGPALPPSNVWTLSGVSVTFPIAVGLLNQTFPAPWLTPGAIYPAGFYALGVLGNGTAGLGPVLYGAPLPPFGADRTGIAPGVFPNPVGLPQANLDNWDIWLDWTAAPSSNSSVSAHGCQPFHNFPPIGGF